MDTAIPDWPVIVISLAGDTRRRRIATRLDDLGIAFSFLDAVDGRKGIPDWAQAKVDQSGAMENLGRVLSGPEIGCALSHQQVYDRIAAENLPGAVVLEDDAELTPVFRDFLHQRCYLQADLIQLCYVNCRVFRFGRRALMPGYHLKRVATASASSAAYSISARGAAHLRAQGLPLVAPADWPCDTLAIGHHVVMPQMVGHPDDGALPSHIAQNREATRQDQQRRRNWGRFLRRSYWRRWLRKRLSVRIA